MTHARLAAGARAEVIAERYLIGRGLRPIARNFRCRVGELDLVMEHRAELVVVEIRYRRQRSPVEPAASITRVKRDRIIRATANFLNAYDRYLDRPLRFDVVALSGPLDRAEIQWLRGAFDCSPQTG